MKEKEQEFWSLGDKSSCKDPQTLSVLAICERIRGVKQKKKDLQSQQSQLDKSLKEFENQLADLLDEMFEGECS